MAVSNARFPVSLRRRGLVQTLPLLLLGAIGVAGCDKKTSITDPGSPPPTLSEIWPNEDGRSWTYRMVSREWDPPEPVLFTSAALVPPVTFDTVAAVFASRPMGTNPTADTVTVQLRFNGTRTVSGVTVQVLEETNPVPSPSRSSHAPALARDIPSALGDPSGQARLRVDRYHGTPRLAGQFLRGGLWRRTSQWIGTHEPSDADTFPDWKFLEADLRPGQTFELALAPGLADVRLHARVVRSLTVSMPGGPVSNGIEVHYYVDHGVSEATDNQGNPIGAFRHFSCGSVLYAPGVGPVSSDERALIYAGGARRPGTGDRDIRLVATTPGPIPKAP